MKKLSIEFLLAGFAFTLSAEVPAWRKDGNGIYSQANAPMDWSKTLWESEMPDRSNASPILVNGRLFLTSEPATLICVDPQNGKILWQKGNEYVDLMDEGKEAALEAKKRAKEIQVELEPLERDMYRARRQYNRDKSNEQAKQRFKEAKAKVEAVKAKLGDDAALQPPPAHKVNGYSSYTPVSDGKQVWACFGNGIVVSYNFDGRRLWHQRLSAPDHNWGGSSSPVLVGGKLIVRFSDYVALDPVTGEELWRLPSEGVVFNAPAHFEREGKHYLITARGELIRVSDGQKLPSSGFKVQAKPWSFMNTPSVVGDHVYFAHGCEGEQGDAYCLRIPDTVADLEEKGLSQVWHQSINKNRYYSSPLVHDGVVYLISREYLMQALDAKSGEVVFSEKVKGFTGTAYPSLSLVGDVVFVGAEDGNAAFFEAGRDFREVGRTKADPYRSTPIFLADRAYLRTQEKLKAISVR